MVTITLPDEILEPLSDQARKQGVSPESLALTTLRKIFVVASPPSANGGTTSPPAGTLYDLLADSIGVIEGSTEPLSQNCSERVTDLLVGEHLRKRP
jgi:hypothetical protein